MDATQVPRGAQELWLCQLCLSTKKQKDAGELSALQHCEREKPIANWMTHWKHSF